MSGQASSDTKLIFPGLAGFYAAVSDLWYPMLRITAGATLFMHGWAKLHSGVTPVVGSMVKAGLAPPTAFAYFTIFLETVGAICIVLGLFTRLFAAIIAIEMAIICFVIMMPAGYFRMEPTLIWGILYFAIALRGGGPYSLDRVIGKEL